MQLEAACSELCSYFSHGNRLVLRHRVSHFGGVRPRGLARGSQKMLYSSGPCLCLAAIISKTIHRRAFFEIDDPQLLLSGLSKNGTLTVMCPRASPGEPNLYHGEILCQFCTDQLVDYFIVCS